MSDEDTVYHNTVRNIIDDMLNNVVQVHASLPPTEDITPDHNSVDVSNNQMYTRYNNFINFFNFSNPCCKIHPIKHYYIRTTL